MNPALYAPIPPVPSVLDALEALVSVMFSALVSGSALGLVLALFGRG